MPLGSGSVTYKHLPDVPFVIDQDRFNEGAKKNDLPADSWARGSDGQTIPRKLLQTGIVSKLWLNFVGTLTVVTASVVTADRWPHGVLGGLVVSAQGQNDLWSVDGLDLDVLRFARNPAYAEHTDTFPGSVGGGNTITVGTYTVDMTFEVPFAVDDFTLVGSLWAQSSSTTLSVKVQEAIMADLFKTNPANASLTGTWYLEERLYEPPFDDQGAVIIPDLTRLHGVNALDTAFTNTGDVPVSLVRSAGSLQRLFVQARNQSASPGMLSALPGTAAASKIDRARLVYGGNQTPFDYNPASRLVAINNDHYSAPLPYNYLCLDQIRENPKRDAVLLQGLTELKWTTTVDSSVSVGTGAKVRLLQETLF